jgi:hypothetical protein
MALELNACQRTHCMELSPPREAASFAATQGLYSILQNLNVHYRVHKNPTLVAVVNQISPVRTTHTCVRSILILSTYQRLGLPSDLFPSDFRTSNLYAFTSSPLVPHFLFISSSMT